MVRRTEGGNPHRSGGPGLLLGQVASFSERLTKIEGQMPALITKEGIPTDSPISAERRAVLKEQMMQHINELQVKVRLLEEREKLGKK